MLDNFYYFRTEYFLLFYYLFTTLILTHFSPTHVLPIIKIVHENSELNLWWMVVLTVKERHKSGELREDDRRIF
jgi:hypothetical protein